MWYGRWHQSQNSTKTPWTGSLILLPFPWALYAQHQIVKLTFCTVIFRLPHRQARLGFTSLDSFWWKPTRAASSRPFKSAPKERLALCPSWPQLVHLYFVLSVLSEVRRVERIFLVVDTLDMMPEHSSSWMLCPHPSRSPAFLSVVCSSQNQTWSSGHQCQGHEVRQ